MTNYLDYSLFMANSEIVPMSIVFSLSDTALVSEFIIREVFFSINGFLAFIRCYCKRKTIAMVMTLMMMK